MRSAYRKNYAALANAAMLVELGGACIQVSQPPKEEPKIDEPPKEEPLEPYDSSKCECHIKPPCGYCTSGEYEL